MKKPYIGIQSAKHMLPAKHTLPAERTLSAKRVLPAKSTLFAKRTLPMLLCIIMLLSAPGLAGCGNREPEASPTPTRTLPPPPDPSTPEPTPEPPAPLVPYNGNIEHIFFHEVIAWPELAFNGNSRQENLNNEYVTAQEFLRILELLYENNYILIDLNDVYSEYITGSGLYKMQQNTLSIPSGKKPLVISFDNLVFNENLIPHGFMSKYVIGIDGEIWAEGTNPDGNTVISQDLAVITILEKFIRDNPHFSHNGAKGCISLSGSQGILGYRTNKLDEETDEDLLRRRQEIAFVKPIIDKLKDNGWYFASHTYSRGSLGNMSLDKVQADAERWLEEVGTLVGKTDILTYPAASRLDGKDQEEPGPALKYYVSIGFRYFAASGSYHYAKIKSDDYNITAVIADRAFICGITLRNHRRILIRFFDTKDIYSSVRPDYTSVMESWAEPNE